MTAEDDAVARFFSNWAMYRAVIDSDSMDHHRIYTEVGGILRRRREPFTLMDLGCGDAAGVAVAVRDTAIAKFTGVDNAAPALALAGETFTGVDFEVALVEQGLETAVRDDHTADVVVMAFALHHFQSPEKREILASIRQRLNPGGELLLIDLVRQPGQSRAEYLEAYLDYVRTWPLPDHIVTAISDHVTGFDFPEEVGTQPQWGLAAGYASVEEFYSGGRDLRGNDTQRGWRLRA